MDPMYQYMAVAGLVVVGVALFLKGGKWWGLAPIAGAVYWLLHLLQGH